MTDPRAANVRQFCEQQGAQQVLILTAVTPFGVSQNRAVVIVWDGRAELVTCSGCTPRTALHHGTRRAIAPETLSAFLAQIDAAGAAWQGDALPPHVHDGVTLTVERAQGGDYQRVRMVAPDAGSPHAQMIAAWASAFPEVRALVS